MKVQCPAAQFAPAPYSCRHWSSPVQALHAPAWQTWPRVAATASHSALVAQPWVDVEAPPHPAANPAASPTTRLRA
jgi:hypothetical protein